MVRFYFLFFGFFLFSVTLPAAEPRLTIPLSGTWEFEQTESAFPPEKFSRKIPVPGLIFLAEPKIEQYDEYYDGSYEPRYNWYCRSFFVQKDAEELNGVVTVLKSKYLTDVFLNGRYLGGSMSSYTPIEFPLGSSVRYGEENELLIRVGDRKWLPSQAAGSTDKEKVTYWRVSGTMSRCLLPGITERTGCCCCPRRPEAR